MNECDHIRDLIADSIAGVLAAEQTRRLDEHLARCEGCHRYAEALKHEDRLLNELVAGVATGMPDRKSRLLQVLGHRQLRQANHLRMWRRIMRSPVTRLTAAGLIIAAMIISISYFSGTTVKAVEFSEITKAMGQVPWMHASSSGFERGFSPFTEYWVGFQSKVHAIRWADGRVSFWKVREHQRTEYDPVRNTITVANEEEDMALLDLSSPMTLLENMHKTLRGQGAEIVARIGDYEGRRVQVQEVSLSNADPRGAWSPRLTLYIDPHNKLLCAARISVTDPNRGVTTAGAITFDYPQTGPEDIYDLGVSRDARIVDGVAANEFRAIRERYEAIRAEATKEYIAVIAITQGDPDDVVRMIDVDWRSDRKHRFERHSVFHSGESLDDLWPHYKEELGDTFESLLLWTRSHYDDPRGSLGVYLYDGEYYGSTIRSGDSGWRKPVKFRTSADPSPPESLVDLAWPRIVSTARIIEDDYARQNGLICIESLSQGRVTPRGWPSLPGRFLYYLDPAQDYLCHRRVTEWRPGADWQKDKNWQAGVDPNKVRHGSITVDEITETFQAPNGHWYPRVIVEQSTGDRADFGSAPLKTDTTKRIYLNVSPEFPEGTFDIDELPGQ
jgi:hypothetical protein